MNFYDIWLICAKWLVIYFFMSGRFQPLPPKVAPRARVSPLSYTTGYWFSPDIGVPNKIIILNFAACFFHPRLACIHWQYRGMGCKFLSEVQDCYFFRHSMAMYYALFFKNDGLSTTLHLNEIFSRGWTLQVVVVSTCNVATKIRRRWCAPFSAKMRGGCWCVCVCVGGGVGQVHQVQPY